MILPIKKKWFDMIKSGEKKEEYRKIKSYYDSRFHHYFEILNFNLSDRYAITEVIFRNGYKKDSPSIKCRVDITTGYGKEEWGAEKNKQYYVLEILEIVEVNE